MLVETKSAVGKWRFCSGEMAILQWGNGDFAVGKWRFSKARKVPIFPVTTPFFDIHKKCLDTVGIVSIVARGYRSACCLPFH